MAEKRKYDDIAVDVLTPSELCYVTNASQRFTKWEKMRVRMCKALGVCTGEEEEENKPEIMKLDPGVEIGERGYIVAKVQHPTKEDTVVCLVEKARNGGYILMPEGALKHVKQRCQIDKKDQQFGTWEKVEEQLGIKATKDYKAGVNSEGFIVNEMDHPTKEGVKVVAVTFPSKLPDGEPKNILIKKDALRIFPNECVEIIEPEDRLRDWPKMAEALGIEEAAVVNLRKGNLGVVKAERKHLKRAEIMVVGVELCWPKTGAVMMKKEALRYTKA